METRTYKVNIDHTYKPRMGVNCFTGIGSDREFFKTSEEAISFINNKYAKYPRAPMYEEDREHLPIKVGYVIRYDSGGYVYEDWITIEELTFKNISDW